MINGSTDLSFSVDVGTGADKLDLCSKRVA